MDAEEKQKFEPNIINSTVYIICLALQVSTFAVNYKVNRSYYTTVVFGLDDFIVHRAILSWKVYGRIVCCCIQF